MPLSCALLLHASKAWAALGRLHEAHPRTGARRPKHSRIRRVQDWIEVEDALAELALLSPER